MRDHDTHEQADTGLSTEDIAGRRDRGEEREPGTEAPPMYPGESTGTGSAAGTAPNARTTVDDDTSAADDTSAPDTSVATERADTEAGRAERRADEAPEDDDAPKEGDAHRKEEAAGEDEAPRLLDAEDEEAFRTRWHEIQSLFVDDPREAVHSADGLVADVMQKLAGTFADHKRNLEAQWSQGENVDTENLRMALRQYRSFFNRLLTT
ncbi:hypothetical protein ACIGEZ_29300 [Streptomyces sp. NPDC085481]|uniref:hypothetical protein n=1 Tax=Streptomyces sp. NPDC085481 TaxID=3365727 RepID=UPI0037D5E389